MQDGDIQFVLRVAAKLRDKPKPPAKGERGLPRVHGSVHASCS